MVTKIFLPITGLEPVLFKESNFKSDVSTKFHQKGFYIPQFDLLSLGAQISGLLFSFSFFYIYNMKNTLPNFIEVKKIRSKKLYVNLNKANDTSSSVQKTFNNETVIFNNMYS